MLAGEIMGRSGLTKRLVNFADSLIGWLRCGLCYVTVITGIFMGGISGSAPADTAALGSVLIPSMRQKKYPAGFSAALMAGSGAIGIIIPPSIPMVVLGGVSNISIGRMFVGGIIPGVLIGLGLMVAACIVCGHKGYGVTDMTSFSLLNLGKCFKDAVLALFAPLLLMGGILSGFFSATEASVVIVVYTFILGVFVYKTIKLGDFLGICSSALRNAANVMLVIGTSTIFSLLLTRMNIPAQIAKLVISISDSPFVVLLIINLVIFLAGMFLDGLPIIIMFVPIFLPIAEQIGMDPIVFGVMFIINIAIGGLTPPVGATLFVSSMTAGIPIGITAQAGIPFIISMIFVLILITAFPILVTFLPAILT
jgi:C4-dicarboxylate transporter DctM subunit